MDSKTILILIGMSLVTYIPRMLPLVVLSKFELPSWFLRWLSYIPVAVLSALLVPGLFLKNNAIHIAFDNKALLAAIPCFLAAIKTKNLFLTVLAGIGTMLLLQLII